MEEYLAQTESNSLKTNYQTKSIEEFFVDLGIQMYNPCFNNFEQNNIYNGV